MSITEAIVHAIYSMDLNLDVTATIPLVYVANTFKKKSKKRKVKPRKK